MTDLLTSNLLKPILPKTRGFKFGMLNINGLLGHIDQLRMLLFDLDFDIMAINETKLDCSYNNDLVKIDGYSLERNDRNKHGGGVALYIRNALSYTVRNDLVVANLEIIVIEVHKPKSKPFLVSTWYRPPGSPSDLFRDFELFLQAVDFEDKESILLGDINCDLAAQPKDSLASQIEFIYDTYQYSQLITGYTRVTNTSKSMIDHLITNKPQTISGSGVLPVTLSDHYLIYGIRKLSSFKSEPRFVITRLMKKYAPELLIEDLNNVQWAHIDALDDPNEMADFWENSFNDVINKYLPIRKRRIRNRPCPWLTKDIRELMHRRDHLKKLYVRSKSEDDWKSYKIARNEVNVAIRKAKKRFATNEISNNEGDSKRTWRAMNLLLGRNSKISCIAELKIDQSICTDSDMISDAFNDHFSSIAAKIEDGIEPTHVSPSSYVIEATSRFAFENVDSSYILKLLSKLDVSKATGLDNIPARLLRDTAQAIANPLCTIFNKCLASGIFPDKWKRAKVQPVHKGNKKNDPCNYRPISILPVIAKVFEKIIFDQLYSYLSSNDILSKFQSGFRPYHSTLTALLQATEEWFHNMDLGLLSGVLFVDFSKAFDTVNHRVLLEKLQLYGIKDKALEMFSSYLDNRSQCCVVNNAFSKFNVIESGVPQGSILGPLLFLVYVNDLPNCLECTTPGMYADDTHVTATASNVRDLEKLLDSDVENLCIWLRANRLSINSSKTEFMMIASNIKLKQLLRDPKIKLGSDCVKRVTTAKLLGVLIDENLSWGDHINNNIIPKVMKGLRMLRTFRSILSIPQLISLYNSLVLPHFDYCSSLWGNCGKVLKSKLQKLQNRAARIITHSSYEIRSAEILKSLGWSDLETRRNIQKAVLMYKIIEGDAPSLLKSRFMKTSELYNYGLRGYDSDLKLPLPHTEFMKRSLSYSGAQLWNTLPLCARKCNSLGKFKKLIE